MSLRVMVCSQHKQSGCVGKLIGAKKGRTFQFNLFLWVICVYYIPHDYVIPQTMPHDIPQTHSSCHPHRVSRAFQEVFPPQMPCCFIRIHARLGTAVEMSQPFHDIARFERFTPCLNMHSITFKTGKRMFSNFIRWCLIFNSSYGGRR